MKIKLAPPSNLAFNPWIVLYLKPYFQIRTNEKCKSGFVRKNKLLVPFLRFSELKDDGVTYKYYEIVQRGNVSISMKAKILTIFLSRTEQKMSSLFAYKFNRIY